MKSKQNKSQNNFLKKTKRKGKITINYIVESTNKDFHSLKKEEEPEKIKKARDDILSTKIQKNYNFIKEANCKTKTKKEDKKLVKIHYNSENKEDDNESLHKFGDDDSSVGSLNEETSKKQENDNDERQVVSIDYSGGIFDPKFSETLIKRFNKTASDTYRGKREMFSGNLAKKIDEEVNNLIFLLF